MNPRHHPNEDILTAYAAGALEPGFGLVAGAHVESCGHCRAQVAALQATSGAALRALPEAELTPGALDRVMSRLDGSRNEPRLDSRPLLQRLPLKTRKRVAPGVWVAAVDTPCAVNNRVYVLSVAPGALTARHTHSGAEFCTVLQGGYRDEVGHFGVGDFAAAEADLNHQPIVDSTEACICLFATEGRLKAQGLLGRLAFAYADV